MANMNTFDESIDLTSASNHAEIAIVRKIGLAILVGGLLLFMMGISNFGAKYPNVFFIISFSMMAIGSLTYILNTYLSQAEGVKNNNITTKSLTSRGLVAWLMCLVLTGFYVIYYWWGSCFENWYRMFDPLSQLIRGKPTESWFFYGTIYTFGVFLMGVRAIVKYRHNRYQIIRTSSVIFAQLVLSWLIPSLLVYFQNPEKYLNYFWPLSIQDGFPSTLANLWSSPALLAKFLMIWSLALTIVGTPILTYFFGKRWYCSWVCGCGGLANTVGDPWRQLSDKRVSTWRLERITIYSVLIFAIITTIYVWYVAATKSNLNINEKEIGITKVYGFIIGAIFSGVIGTGFYPILGTRIWCRFGCPQAAILGILQRFFSRFRITTNGAQCISCGNCSKYCEMGIDVRSYAQRGLNIVRASCVGCGMCSVLCPRGVINLENGPLDTRENRPLSVSDIVKFDKSTD